MNQKTKSVIFCLLFLLSSACSQSARQTERAPGGEFSYVPPESWVEREVPGHKYKVAFGQPNAGFTPNINVVDEYAPVTLDDYVAGNLRVMPQMFEKMGITHFTVLSQTDFTTDANQRGVRMVTESEVSGKKIRQIYYFFEGKDGNKFVVTSVSAEAGESYDKLFDTSMKTFKPTRA